MGNFKVGDYIVDGVGRISRVVRISKIIEGAAITERVAEPKGLTDKTWNRRATVLDYIKSMNLRQVTKFLYHVNTCCCTHFNQCTSYDHCWIYKSKNTNGFDKKLEVISQWLNQPLTDELVKQLGGENNG